MTCLKQRSTTWRKPLVRPMLLGLILAPLSIGLWPSSPASATPTNAPTPSGAEPNAGCTSGCWIVESVGSPTGTTGAWHACAAVRPTTYPFTYSCSFTEGFSNQVSGSLQVTDNALSEAVGFSVTETRSVTDTISTGSIPDNQTGEVYWAFAWDIHPVEQYDIGTGATAWVDATNFEGITGDYVESGGGYILIGSPYFSNDLSTSCESGCSY